MSNFVLFTFPCIRSYNVFGWQIRRKHFLNRFFLSVLHWIEHVIWKMNGMYIFCMHFWNRIPSECRTYFIIWNRRISKTLKSTYDFTIFYGDQLKLVPSGHAVCMAYNYVGAHRRSQRMVFEKMWLVSYSRPQTCFEYSRSREFRCVVDLSLSFVIGGAAAFCQLDRIEWFNRNTLLRTVVHNRTIAIKKTLDEFALNSFYVFSQMKIFSRSR